MVLNGTTEITGNGQKDFNHLLITGTVVASADFNVTGNFTNNGSFDSTDSDVSFTGGSAATIAGSVSPTTIDSLIVAKNAATVSQAVNLSIGSTLAISSGTLDSGAFSLGQAAAGGEISISGGAKLKLGGSNPFPAFDTVTLDPASTVEYAGSGAQGIAAQNYGNLTSSSTGSRTLASTGTIGVGGPLHPWRERLHDHWQYHRVQRNGQPNRSRLQLQPPIEQLDRLADTCIQRHHRGRGHVFTRLEQFHGKRLHRLLQRCRSNHPGLHPYGNLTTAGSGTKTLGGNVTVGSALSLSAGSFADGGFTATVNGDIANAVTHTGTGKILLVAASPIICCQGAALSKISSCRTPMARLSASPI